MFKKKYDMQAIIYSIILSNQNANDMSPWGHRLCLLCVENGDKPINKTNRSMAYPVAFFVYTFNFLYIHSNKTGINYTTNLVISISWQIFCAEMLFVGRTKSNIIPIYTWNGDKLRNRSRGVPCLVAKIYRTKVVSYPFWSSYQEEIR